MKTVKVPRTRISQYEIDTNMDNPEGILLNTGETLPIGEVLDVLEEVDLPLHELMGQYERFESPYFRMGAETARGLWRMPGWDILATTWFEHITPFARAEGIEDMPYTTLMAFRRDENGEPEDRAALEWVMQGTHNGNA